MAVSAPLLLVLAIMGVTSQDARPAAQAFEAVGVIEGMATGPRGALVHVPILVRDKYARVVGKAVTNRQGAFRVGGLGPGTYLVQLLGKNGVVISTATATITSASPTVTVAMNATSAAIAGAAAGVGGGAAVAGAGSSIAGAAAAAAGTTGISAAAVVMSVAFAATVSGAAAVRSTMDDTSPSR